MSKFKEAFLAGFNASGEGWNGEHGVDEAELEAIYSEWLESIDRIYFDETGGAHIDGVRFLTYRVYHDIREDGSGASVPDGSRFYWANPSEKTVRFDIKHKGLILGESFYVKADSPILPSENIHDVLKRGSWEL